ncbi:hypothetical protein [Thiocapsa marina]|uniref:hypothetical protein n=1 Tax=Thiocapsa marina TaxID=244573 RepID=UPI001F3A9F23|nr:hypothetical protein [Thiocapsa marina]
MSDASAPRRTTALLWVIAGLLLVGVVAVAVYKAWPLLNPTLVEVAPLDPSCDLRAGPCDARLAGGGRVRFGIEPRSIPVVTPLRLAVETTGLNVRAVEVDFAGVDMNMGYNRTALASVGPGVYEGQGTLPVCVRARMDWEARVLVHTPEGILAAPFRFETRRD